MFAIASLVCLVLAAPAPIPPADNLEIADLKLKMVWIAPGSFDMGSASGKEDERPVTRVTLTKGYWLGATEVTQAQWTAVMGGNQSSLKGLNLPVAPGSWTEAMDFCRRLTERERAAGRLPAGFEYTLPTEAQWEYACRAGTRSDHSGSLDAMGWYSTNSGLTTHDVGQKQANAWGLFDIHGNVWEWCLDWYGNYPGGAVTDPGGALSGAYRVVRGGGYGNDAERTRSAIRGWFSPDFTVSFIGFRVALAAVR